MGSWEWICLDSANVGCPDCSEIMWVEQSINQSINYFKLLYCHFKIISQFSVAVVYYYTYKRSALMLGDPRFYRDSPWLREQLKKHWYFCYSSRIMSNFAPTIANFENQEIILPLIKFLFSQNLAWDFLWQIAKNVIPTAAMAYAPLKVNHALL